MTELEQLRAQLETSRTVLLEARDHLYTKQDMDRCRQMAKDALAQIGSETLKAEGFVKTGERNGVAILERINVGQKGGSKMAGLCKGTLDCLCVECREEDAKDRLDAQRYRKLIPWAKSLQTSYADIVSIIRAPDTNSAVNALPEPDVRS